MIVLNNACVFEMLTGLPGSGKSNSYKKINLAARSYGKPTEVVSSDQIRKELYGSESIQGNSSDIFALMRDKSLSALNSGYNVIYDATNLSFKKRKCLLDYLKLKVSKSNSVQYECTVFATPIELCKKRNSKRDRIVQEDVIDRMYLNFQTPIYQEGWDNICLDNSVNWTDLGYNCAFSINKHPDIKDRLRSLEDVSHNNPHHVVTLKEHMRLAEDYLMENIDLSEQSDINAFLLINAIRYHDIGKFYTKTWKNSIAHYYGHENVGAYEYLSWRDHMLNDSDILAVASFINYHMRPFNWDNNKKAKDRDIKLFGKNFCDYLSIMHRCDIHCEDWLKPGVL